MLRRGCLGLARIGHTGRHVRLNAQVFAKRRVYPV